MHKEQGDADGQSLLQTASNISMVPHRYTDDEWSFGAVLPTELLAYKALLLLGAV